jgi:hypothetical protein
MSTQRTQLFTGLFILVAFISVGVFGLLGFNHMSETPMVNCPYTQNDSSLCVNTLDHITKWQQFSNIISPALFIFSLLALALVLYFTNKQNLLNQKQSFYRWKYYLNNKTLYTFPNIIIKWLSLFENSPSLLYARHT